MKNKTFTLNYITLVLLLITVITLLPKTAYTQFDLMSGAPKKDTIRSETQAPAEEEKPAEKPFAEIAIVRAKEVKRGIESLKTQNENDRDKIDELTLFGKTLPDTTQIEDIIEGLKDNIKLRERLISEKQRLADMLEFLSDGIVAVVKERERASSRNAELTKAAESPPALPDKTYSRTDLEVVETELDVANAEAETRLSQIETIKNELLAFTSEKGNITDRANELKEVKDALSHALTTLKRKGEGKDKTEVLLNSERIKVTEDRLNLAKEYLALLNELSNVYGKQIAYLNDKLGVTQIQAENAALLARTKEMVSNEIRQRVGIQMEEVEVKEAEAEATLKEAEREKEQVEKEKITVRQEKVKAEEKEKLASEEKKRLEEEYKTATSEMEKAAAAEKEDLARHKHLLAETELGLSKEKEKFLNEKNSLIALKGKFAQTRLDVTTDLASLTQELIRYPDKTAPLEEKLKTLGTLKAETSTIINVLKKEIIQLENEIKTIEQRIEAAEKKAEQRAGKLTSATDIETANKTLELVSEIKDTLAQHLDVTRQRLALSNEKLNLTKELANFYADAMKILSPYRKIGEKKIVTESFIELYKNSKTFVHQAFVFFSTWNDKYNKTRNYLSTPDNLQLVIHYLIRLGINIILWFSASILIRLYLRRTFTRIPIPSMGLANKISLCILKILYSCTISSIILAATYISIKILYISPQRVWPSIVFFALIAYIVYRLIYCLTDHLFAPDENVRLIMCKNRTATFFQKWIKGITKYIAILIVIKYSAKTLGASEVLLFLLRSIFNIGLLVFFIILANFWKHEIVKFFISSTRKEPGEIPIETRLTRFKFYRRIIGYLYTFFIFYTCTIIGLSIAGYTGISKYLTISSIETLGAFLIGLAIYHGLKISLLKTLSQLSEIAKKKEAVVSLAFVYIAIRYAIVFMLGFIVLNFILAFWNVPLYRFIALSTFLSIIRRFVLVIVIIVASHFFLKFFAVFIDKLFTSTTVSIDIFSMRRKQTLAPLIKSTAKYLTFFFAAILILRQLGVNATTIIAGVGIAGLAIGFGAQTLVKDIITGFFIIFEDSISVGDVVMVGEIGGFVEEVGLRVTKLRTLSGELKVIPNGEISKIGNFNRGWMRAIIQVGIAYEGDIDKAMKTLKEIADQYAAEHPDIVLEPPEVQGVLELGASEVTIRVLIKVLPMRHWEVEREMKLRIKRGFDEKGIEIPFARRVVYTREDKSFKEKTGREKTDLLLHEKETTRKEPPPPQREGEIIPG